MYFKSVSDWIDWIKHLHPVSMDLSLERVLEVGKRLTILNPDYSVITVAGTNGKGSSVAGLESIYLEGGYRVGAFTSPFLFRYNEQVRINGIPVEDAVFCRVFEQIASACEEITLTPFEFTTLAALMIFKENELDIVILEVGLGGRWDSVNVIDADVAIVTTIAIDHAAILGDTREKIGYEKAGIFRSSRPAVCGDFDPPLSLLEYARKLKTPLYCQGSEFYFIEEKNSWTWKSDKTKLENLPLPTLALQNIATVLMAVELLQKKRPVSREAIDRGLTNVRLTGRIQIVEGDITRIFDVSHNPAAAEFLVEKLEKKPCKGKTRAVFSMLADKDIVSTLLVMNKLIDEWFIAPLPVPRGASIDYLAECFRKAGIQAVSTFKTINAAYESAMNESKTGDSVIIFGSFHTVAATFNARA